jgi:protein-tyrosine-phosphatase
MNPKAIECMREKGLDLGAQRSKGLDELPPVAFDAAITMGCGDACPSVRARVHEDWQIPDPREMGPDGMRAVRDRIENEVVGLLRRLRDSE